MLTQPIGGVIAYGGDEKRGIRRRTTRGSDWTEEIAPARHLWRLRLQYEVAEATQMKVVSTS